MRILAIPAAAVAAFLVGSLTPPALSAAQPSETEKVSRRIPLSPGGTLKLKTFSGKVTITGSDSSEVSVDAVRRGTRERLDRIKLDIHSSGSVITIDANKRDRTWRDWLHGKNTVVETDFEIRVPSRTNVEVSSFSSPVTVNHVNGRHEVHGFSSMLRLSDIAGRLRAHTFSGDIRVQLAASENQPQLDLDSFSGDIDVRVPANANAGLSFNSFSGNLKSDVPLTLKSSSRRNIRATMNGREGSRVKFKTFSGDVRITKQ
jgi:DUF4097 and DUF4098 domain-containing protein YvlB